MNCPPTASPYQRAIWNRFIRSEGVARDGCMLAIDKAALTAGLEESKDLPGYAPRCWHGYVAKQPEYRAVGHLPFTDPRVWEAAKANGEDREFIVNFQCLQKRWEQERQSKYRQGKEEKPEKGTSNRKLWVQLLAEQYPLA